MRFSPSGVLLGNPTFSAGELVNRLRDALRRALAAARAEGLDDDQISEVFGDLLALGEDIRAGEVPS